MANNSEIQSDDGVTENTINLRCYGTDDNVCEKIVNNECETCMGCGVGNNYFSIMNFGDYFTVSYHHKIGDLVIERHSERIGKDLKELKPKENTPK